MNKGLMRNALLRELEGISSRSRDPREFRRVAAFIEKICDPGTPSFETGYSAFDDAAIGCMSRVSEQLFPQYMQLRERISRIIYDIGHRRGIYTIQEHFLMGSTIERESQNPYIPTGILGGNITIVEAAKARNLKVYMNSIRGYLTDEAMLPVLLEPLDPQGRTLRDPRVIDLGKLKREWAKGTDPEMFVVMREKSPDLPFRRD